MHSILFSQSICCVFAGKSGAKSNTLLSSITLNWNDAQLPWTEAAFVFKPAKMQQD
jgi:hypothetical protein